MTMFFLDESNPAADPSEEHRPAVNALVSRIPIVVAVGDLKIGEHTPSFSEPDVEVSVNATDDATGDEAGRAALFGRYMGQITARIARAWVRPRSPAGPGQFSCWVQVDQDATGAVQEVTLKKCNGTPDWQVSLVHAIESASPLPAPSDPAVFTQRLTFEMSSDGFDPKGSADGFESEPVQPAALAASGGGSEALRTFIDQVRAGRAAVNAVDVKPNRRP